MEDITYNSISAVQEGSLERTRKLISAFGLSYSSNALLCEALENNHVAVAKLLLTNGCEVNNQDNTTSDTPLHFAAKSGDIEIVKMILDRGVDIDAKNKYGISPLHNAIANKNIKVTELLLKHTANINVRSDDSKTPLFVATEIGCLKTIELLLNYGANVNCLCNSTRPCQKYAPLHLAVKKSNKEVVLLLLSRGANVNVEGKDSITPLHVAARIGNVDIAQVLLNHGACVDSITEEGYTKLNFASTQDNKDAMKLLNEGSDVITLSKYNLTPLAIAIKAGHEPVVKLLLEHGAGVDNQDNDGNTILNLAVEKGSLMIVKNILKYCPDIYNQNNRSSLKTAVFGQGEEYKMIVEALVEYGFNVNSEDANDSRLLHAAVEKGYLKIVNDLLELGANINVLLLHHAIYEEGFTPLHRATKYKQEEVAKLLISKGADINAKDEIGRIPIFYAIKNGSIEIVQDLLRLGVDVNANDCLGETALHFAADSRYSDIRIQIEIAKLLLSKGANVNAQVNGFTALHIASIYSQKEMVKLLLDFGSKVDPKSECSISPLHLSADFGFQENVEMILKFGADVNSRSEGNITALHNASEEGHVEVVKTLLEYGADINCTDSNNNTPLGGTMEAIMSSYVCMVIDDRNGLFNFRNDNSLHNLETTVEVLTRHIVKLKSENLFVSEKNLQLLSNDKIRDFRDKCEKEIASLKSEKFINSNISFYDILVKDTSTLAKYLRNENILQVLKSDDYKIKFPLYSTIIESNFRKAIVRKSLYEHGHKIFNFLFSKFPKLPHYCTEMIISYLSDKDIRILMNACKPLSIGNTNFNDTVIT